jgi:Tol biopolymer transport system component
VPWQQASNRLQFSADGRFLAFDLYERQNQRDVHVLATDGSRGIEAVVHPADDELLGWSSDGSRLLFFSDRSGPGGLWTLQMMDGRPSGAPRLVRSELGVPGRFAALGLTSDGDLFYTTSRPKNAGIQIAGVDITAGRLVSLRDAGAELASTNNVYSFAWSRNGESLAVSRRVQPGMVDTYRLSIKDMKTGSVREIRPQSGYCTAWMNWSADGRFFVCQGVYSEERNGVRHDRMGVLQLDATTGQASYLGAGRAVALSPNSRTAYLLRDDQRDGVSRVVLIERQLASGDERELTSRPTMGRLRISPDGSLLATRWSNPITGDQSILVVPVSGAPAREVVSVPRGETLEILFWAPDGASLIARKVTERATSATVRVSLVDGKTTPAPDLDLPNNNSPLNVQLSPDGRHVAYSVSLEGAVEVHRLDRAAIR